MDVPEERVQIAIAESGLLKQYLAALSPDAWDAPSACDRWVVRDVVAHLAAVAEAYIPRIHQSLEGEGRPMGRGGRRRWRKDGVALGPNDEVRFLGRGRDFLGKYVRHGHNVVHEDHAMMVRWDIVPPGEGD